MVPQIYTIEEMVKGIVQFIEKTINWRLNAMDLQFTRHRRLRQTANMRALVRENFLRLEDLIYPLFVVEGSNIKNEVTSMPGVFQLSLDNLHEEMNEAVSLGIKSVLLFGIPAEKDEFGKEAYHDHGIVQEAIRYIKRIFRILL